jgi:hypothetical protein
MSHIIELNLKPVLFVACLRVEAEHRHPWNVSSQRDPRQVL